MSKIIEFLPILFPILFLIVIWIVIRKIFRSLSDRINNSELYKENVLEVLEGIREELKKLNENNSGK